MEERRKEKHSRICIPYKKKQCNACRRGLSLKDVGEKGIIKSMWMMEKRKNEQEKERRKNHLLLEMRIGKSFQKSVL